MFEQHNTRNQYIKNYSFDFDFAQSLGQCEVTMTCVTGHLTNVEFTSEYKNWSYPPPETLFNAPIVTSVHDVCVCYQVDVKLNRGIADQPGPSGQEVNSQKPC